MTRHHALGLAAVILIGSSPAAAGIHRGPATRAPEFAPRGIVVTPADRVRIETVWDPARVPEPLRGKFVGSVAGLNHENLTVVLADGEPAVVHRDLVKQFDMASQHGPRWKHTLIGAGIGAFFGALAGAASSGGDTWINDAGELALIGAIFYTPIGALIGAAFPAGETWKKVPLERVEWEPGQQSNEQ